MNLRPRVTLLRRAFPHAALSRKFKVFYAGALLQWGRQLLPRDMMTHAGCTDFLRLLSARFDGPLEMATIVEPGGRFKASVVVENVSNNRVRTLAPSHVAPSTRWNSLYAWLWQLGKGKNAVSVRFSGSPNVQLDRCGPLESMRPPARPHSFFRAPPLLRKRHQVVLEAGAKQVVEVEGTLSDGAAYNDVRAGRCPKGVGRSPSI